MNPHSRADLARDVAKMLVVREIDDLTRRRHFREQTESFLRAEVIEGLHDVVGDKRNRASGFGELEIAGDAQCEIELEARAPGHFRRQFGALV